MPETPNNKMEELLRKHAEKRRSDAAGFSLHPATRRLLQGEIQRQFPQHGAAPQSPRSFWTILLAWRGVAVASCGLVAVLAAGVWLFSRNDAALPASTQPALARLDAPAPATPELPPSRGVDALRAPALSPAPTEQPPVLTKAAGPETATRDAERSEPALNLKAMRPADKLAGDVLLEKQVALTDSPRPSLAPAAPAATPAPATKPDFDQAAMSAAQQRSLALNGANVSVNDNAPVLNAPAAQQNVVRMKGAPPPPAQVVSATAAGVQNSALQNNQQQSDFLANATPANQAPSQTYFRAQQQIGTAGALANNSTASQQLEADVQRLTSMRQNAASGEPAQIAQTPAPAREALQNSAQGDAYRLSRDESRLPVLSQFVVEQSGQNIRVIDADNSVYAGTLSEAKDLGADSSTQLREEQVAQEFRARAPGQRFYRFIGTNKTSGELVVLDAQLPPGTATQQTFVAVQPPDVRRARGGGVAAQTIPSAPTLPSTTPLTRERLGRDTADGTNVVLEGFLRVGGRASQTIRAIPVNR